jgi:hypothetical protein
MSARVSILATLLACTHHGSPPSGTLLSLVDDVPLPGGSDRFDYQEDTGAGHDVLSIDATRGWLYVAAESGDLTIWDITQPGTALVGHDDPGDNAHSVAADPASHRVFFPLPLGTAWELIHMTTRRVLFLLQH